METYFDIQYQNFLPTNERHPKIALELIYRCLNPNPALRPRIEEVMANEWIKTAPSTLDQELLNEM
jgi:serine/threonine protein kinase